jgi:hypothetical protein
MQALPIILLLLLSSISVSAQSKWKLYLGKEMDTLYTKNNGWQEHTNGLHHIRVADYPHFRHTVLKDSNNQSTSQRLGLLLEAKSTEHVITKERIVYGNEDDSVIILYERQTEVIRHGRSTALSVLNFFSKKEEKTKQEVTFEELFRKKAGTIQQGDNTYSFLLFTNSKNNKQEHWLLFDTVKLQVIPGKLFQQVKKGEIKPHKNSNGSWQLMRGNTCIAALDYNTSPITFYCIKEMSEKEKLVIAAFFLVQSLAPPNRSS